MRSTRSRARGVAIAAVLALAPSGSVLAQAGAPGGVVITSKSRIELPPPRRWIAAAPMMPATGGFELQRWFGQNAAPPSLPTAQRPVVVLAGDIKLENRSYPIGAPQLLLVADTLHVGPNATIDLSSRGPRSGGGTIYLIARKIECESGGRLQLVSKGGPMGGSGGRVVIVPGAGAAPPCVAGVVDGGPGGTMEVRDHRTTPTRVTTQVIPNGRPGSVNVSALAGAIQSDPMAQTAWSMWALEWLQTLQLEIYDATRANDNQKVLTLLRSYEGFDVPAGLIAVDMRDRYRQLLGDLNTYRTTALPALLVESLTVRPGGLPQTVTVFTEGASLRASLAPTHALAARESAGGRSVLGLIEYRDDRPDELAIEVEWELTVDPWIERLAAQQLASGGQKLDGVFAGWALEPKPMQELGIRSATGTLLPGGQRLRVRFIVDAQRANLVFWRLLNSAGIPWTVDWRYAEPRSGRVVTGTWAGPPLTLVRQKNPSVTVDGGQLVNGGNSPVVVNYVQAGDGTFVALTPVVRLDAGEKRALSLPGGAAPARVPAEAIETAFDPDRFASDFHVLNGEQVVDRVLVTNVLPTSDAERGVFDYLEITVTASVEGDATVAPATTGPFRLSAAGTRGGEISIPFLRLARGARRVSVAGRAHYANGYRTLEPTSFDTLTISITPEMLKR